ncbi:MAG: SPOR domain-containing protein [Mariprofundaceae bacterium]|nr:SPOR domain-containing protein [Mariprofundaceae bacterium]
MKKILKPLIFAVCLVVVFAIGYTLGPGKGTTVDNSDELERLQKQLTQKNKQMNSLQQSLDVLKQEQTVLKQDMAAKNADQATKSSTYSAAQDSYTTPTDVGDLTFYNDLPKQAVKPEPLQADAKQLASGSQAVVKPMASAKGDAKQGKAATSVAGTSNKPLDAADVLTPSTSKVQRKEKPLPSRYIPPGFERGHVVTPPKASKTGAYVVQMGSFKSKEATATLRKKLTSHGFTAHVKQGDVKGKAVFRVMVGLYQSYADAKQVRAMLKKKIGIEGLMVKVKK